MHPLVLGTIGAGLLALTVSLQSYLSMLDHGHSFVRMMVWQLCSWSVWALATPTLLRLGERLSNRPTRTVYGTVAGMAALVIAAHVLVASLSTVLVQPYLPVETFSLQRATLIHVLSIPADVVIFGVLLLIGSSLAVSHRARTLEIRESRLEADLARAQLDALRLEIEPHFLFNTLNSIASLIRTRSTDRALSMLLGLSDLLRATVDGRRHTTTLGDETEFVKRYIELQQVRFSDRLDVQYAISPSLSAVLCRRSCCSRSWRTRSGMASPNSLDRAALEVSASVENGELHVCVRDNGAGLPRGLRRDRATPAPAFATSRVRGCSGSTSGAAGFELGPAHGGGTVARFGFRPTPASFVVPRPRLR